MRLWLKNYAKKLKTQSILLNGEILVFVYHNLSIQIRFSKNYMNIMIVTKKDLFKVLKSKNTLCRQQHKLKRLLLNLNLNRWLKTLRIKFLLLMKMLQFRIKMLQFKFLRRVNQLRKRIVTFQKISICKSWKKMINKYRLQKREKEQNLKEVLTQGNLYNNNNNSS